MKCWIEKNNCIWTKNNTALYICVRNSVCCSTFQKWLKFFLNWLKCLLQIDEKCMHLQTHLFVQLHFLIFNFSFFFVPIKTTNVSFACGRDSFMWIILDIFFYIRLWKRHYVFWWIVRKYALHFVICLKKNWHLKNI